MHVGRIAHPLNLPGGGEIVAPSAIRAAGEMYTDQDGPQPHPEPRAMSADDVDRTLEEFVQAAKNAREAGFDGIELHGANGYLIDQFLNPKANQREDDWGGSTQNRNRFAIEAARRCADAIGAKRVGIRLSPYGVFNDLAPFDGIDEQYAALAKALGELGIGYIHTVDHSSMGAPEVPDRVKDAIRESFGGPIMLSGGYDGARAEADLAAGKGDLVAFSRPFLGNPDLLTRFAKNAPLNDLRMNLFYTPGPEGYTDYPRLEE
jgi:N-ethylmaleimide reductase